MPTGDLARWRSLDVLRGMALFMMVAHHLQMWTGGEVDERFIGTDRLAVTHLAAPMFTVAVGASAVLVGERVRGAAGWWGITRRWGWVLALGIAIDLVDGDLHGGGVLPTLAVVGWLVTALAATGIRAPAVWWGVALLSAFVVLPATDTPVEGFVPQLLAGRFALPVYLLLAAGGAAVAAHGRGRGEAALPLLPAAGGILLAGIALAATVPSLVAPEGLWPPVRYPGDLSYTVCGLVGTLLLWALLRVAVRHAPALWRAVARAGQRTLIVFAGHFLVRVLLEQLGVRGDLDTWRWGLAAWAVTIVICVAACLPRRGRRHEPEPEPIIHRELTAVR